MLRFERVTYDYRLRGKAIRVLDTLSHTFERGTFTSIRGASGSGKSTLMNVLGLLTTPTQGRYLVQGVDTAGLNDGAASGLRAGTFGYLFQDFRLIPTLSALENVRLNLDVLGRSPKRDRDAIAAEALASVGLGDRRGHLPAELSGGEAQRVAFARAIVKKPSVLLADEPTGNLDAVNRDHLLTLITDYHLSGGTVVMVTHDDEAARASDIRLVLHDRSLHEA